MPSTNYPMGARVTFADDSATMALADVGKVRVSEGIVNGRPIYDEARGIDYVPLWCERVGREATTVYVASTNVLSVVPFRLQGDA